MYLPQTIYITVILYIFFLQKLYSKSLTKSPWHWGPDHFFKVFFLIFLAKISALLYIIPWQMNSQFHRITEVRDNVESFLQLEVSHTIVWPRDWIVNICNNSLVSTVSVCVIDRWSGTAFWNIWMFRCKWATQFFHSVLPPRRWAQIPGSYTSKPKSEIQYTYWSCLYSVVILCQEFWKGLTWDAF